MATSRARPPCILFSSTTCYLCCPFVVLFVFKTSTFALLYLHSFRKVRWHFYDLLRPSIASSCCVTRHSTSSMRQTWVRWVSAGRQSSRASRPVASTRIRTRMIRFQFRLDLKIWMNGKYCHFIKKCHVTLWQSPSFLLVSFGDTLPYPPCLVLFEWLLKQSC